MATGSIKSSFQFKSFKVDGAHFYAKPDLALLRNTDAIPSEAWEISVTIRPPLYFSQEKIYAGGFDLSMQITLPKSSDSDNATDLPSEGNEIADNVLLKLDLGIAGSFEVKERMAQGLEESLVKVQIPALLMPFARSAAASFLASAGYGAVLFPLFNIHELAKRQMAELNVEVVE